MLSDIFFHQTVTYTRTEQEIIDFICKNPGVFLTASISQLAEGLASPMPPFPVWRNMRDTRTIKG